MGLESKLCNAVRKQKLSRVVELLDRKADVSVIASKDGHTALTLAAQSGSVEVLERLLGSLQTDLNTVLDQSGMTALMHAADKGFVDCLDLLLEAKATLDSVDMNGFTALDYATGSEDPACLQLLMSVFEAEHGHAEEEEEEVLGKSTQVMKKKSKKGKKRKLGALTQSTGGQEREEEEDPLADIDAIFANLKKKPAGQTGPKRTISPPPAKPARPVDDMGFMGGGPISGGRKTTKEGFPIYSLEELKVGLGGGTPDCPFECWCCY
jgi:hypothetical protein